nr:ABC transporter permease subunit [uncultured Rhodoferax sp.]
MSELQNYLPALLRGVRVTLSLAFFSLLIALVLGLLGALARQYGARPVARLATAYSTVIRGVPEFVMLLLIFYGGQMLLNKAAAALGMGSPDVDAFSTAVLTLGFIFGAYFSETFRGAMMEVPRGQMEAAYAYGFTPVKAFWCILFPQMIRLALPAASNNWLVLLKTTATASLIGLHDVMFMADQAGRANGAPMTFYLAACVLYLILTTGSGALLAYVGRTYAKGVRPMRLQS